MGNTLKIEAFAGASGDMFLGALAGLAEAYESLKNLPALLHLEHEAEIGITDVVKSGIACKHVKVIEKIGEHGHHHHEVSHLHGHEHHHRHIDDIYELIGYAEINDNAKRIAKEIFHHLGSAEAQIHGIPIEKVHFHEVGAIDSIMDIVGSAFLMDQLAIEKVYSTPVTTGFGFVSTEHGKLPVPTPATQLLLHGFPTKQGDQAGELITPTGAAILKYLQPDFEIPVLKEINTSYGPGEKDLEIPNALRLSLCEGVKEKDNIVVIQTNIDDLSGEYLGLEFQQKLLDCGALDFYMEQVVMKKGRPGVILTVLVPEGSVKKTGEFILENTTSIGLRYYPAERMELQRKSVDIETGYGTVKAKEVTLSSGGKRLKPESDDIFRISKETGLPPLEIIRQITGKIN